MVRNRPRKYSYGMVVETVATEVSARITVKEKLAPGVKAEFGSDANT